MCVCDQIGNELPCPYPHLHLENVHLRINLYIHRFLHPFTNSNCLFTVHYDLYIDPDCVKETVHRRMVFPSVRRGTRS